MMTSTQTAETVHHFRRGDVAMTLGFGGANPVPAERVEVLGGRNITVGIRETERTERWLKVRFEADGAVLLCHPSSLVAVTTHHLDTPHLDTAEICTCGTAFADGFNKQAVKVDHLAAFLTIPEVAAQIVANMTPGELADVANGHSRGGHGYHREGLDVAVWNAAIDRANGYTA